MTEPKRSSGFSAASTKNVIVWFGAARNHGWASSAKIPDTKLFSPRLAFSDSRGHQPDSKSLATPSCSTRSDSASRYIVTRLLTRCEKQSRAQHDRNAPVGQKSIAGRDAAFVD